MFSAFRKAKGLEAAVMLLRQTIAPLTVFGRTVPSSIFSDPYVLGYLTTIAGFAVEVAVKGKLSTDELGEVATKAFHEIAGINGQTAVQNTIRFSSEREPSFLLGNKRANQFIEIMYGGADLNDPDIAEAFQVAPRLAGSFSFLDKNGENPTAANAAAAFSFIHFHQYIQDQHPG